MVKGMLYTKWLSQLGVSRTTGWRWIRDGKVKILPVYGRRYITEEEIERFFREGQAFVGPDVTSRLQKGRNRCKQNQPNHPEVKKTETPASPAAAAE